MRSILCSTTGFASTSFTSAGHPCTGSLSKGDLIARLGRIFEMNAIDNYRVGDEIAELPQEPEKGGSSEDRPWAGVATGTENTLSSLKTLGHWIRFLRLCSPLTPPVGPQPASPTGGLDHGSAPLF